MVTQFALALGGASVDEGAAHVTYKWNLWSNVVQRTERAAVMELPDGLQLAAYLCRLRYCWQVRLRVENRYGKLVAEVATISIPDAAPDGWWEIGRARAGEKIAEWLAAAVAGGKIARGVYPRNAA